MLQSESPPSPTPGSTPSDNLTLIGKRVCVCVGGGGGGSGGIVFVGVYQ